MTWTFHWLHVTSFQLCYSLISRGSTLTQLISLFILHTISLGLQVGIATYVAEQRVSVTAAADVPEYSHWKCLYSVTAAAPKLHISLQRQL